MWCHHALRVEAALDRNDRVLPSSSPSQRTVRARQEIELADRYLDDTSIDISDPREWATVAQQATRLVDQAYRDLRARNSINRPIVRGLQPRRVWTSGCRCSTLGQSSISNRSGRTTQ
jgi:hypothetical protein